MTHSTTEVLALTGLTWKQLDHSYREGYLIPDNPGRGSGSRLRWSDNETAVIYRLAQVFHALGEPFNFANLARQHAARLRAGHGVMIVWDWGAFQINPVTS